MHIERHIFGSYKGYTTLARSPGVSADDCNILESSAYSFGQTYDARFNKTLAKTPAFFTRVLRGGRRALSRVLEGATDDNDRPTLRVVTVIVSQQDWDSQLSGDVQLLLEEDRLWQWDGSAQLPVIEVTFPPPSHSIPRKSVPRVLALLSEIERNYAAHRGVVVSADEFSQQEITCLEMLVPPLARAEFTSAYRTLSPQLPATVNCLASQAGSQDRITFRFQSEHTPLSPYAQYLNDSGFSCGSIPLESIMTSNRFGMSPVQSPSVAQNAPVSPTPVTIVQRSQTLPLVAVALAAMVLCIGAFVAAVLIGRNTTDRLGDDVVALRKDAAAKAAMIEELKQSNKKSEQDLDNKIKDAQDKTGLATTVQTESIVNNTATLATELHELTKGLAKVTGDLKNTQTRVDALEKVLQEQEKARLECFSQEADRLIKKVKDEGLLRQNSGEFRLLVDEAAYLEKGRLDTSAAESFQKRKTEIESLFSIVSIAEKMAELDKQIDGVRSKARANQKTVANEIEAEVGRLGLKLENFKPKDVTTTDVEDILVGLKERLKNVQLWVNDHRSGKDKPTTAMGQLDSK